MLNYTETKNHLQATQDFLDRRRATRAAYGAILCDFKRGQRLAAVASFPGLDDTQKQILAVAVAFFECGEGTIPERHKKAKDLLFYLVNQEIN